MKAFPIPSYVNANGETHDVQHQGMDLRDYLAAKAMQGILTGADSFDAKWIAEFSYEMADAMMIVRTVK
jgi:hypothetical protein